MVAELIKRLLLGSSGLFSLVISSAGVAGPANDPQHNATIIAAHAQLAAATRELEVRTSECDGMRETLPPELFSNISASDDELRTSLAYLSIRADNQCVKHEAAQFVVAALLLEGQFDRNGGTAPHAPMTTLIMESLQTEIERLTQYRQVSADLRRELERIDRLNKPFNLIETARGLELY